MRRKMLVHAAAAIAAALVLGSALAGTGPRPSSARGLALEGGAPSVDALLERFLGALRHKDAKRLRKLRLTKAEYEAIVLPGTVEKGAPLRSYTDEGARFFWGLNNTKSIYNEANLLEQFGGHPYRIVSVNWVEGEKEYATYKAFRQLELKLAVVGEEAREAYLRTGSVIEVGGRYKFASYIRD